MNQAEKKTFVANDYKEAVVERAQLSQYLDGYECFGWQAEREPESAGGDMVRLALKRNRHILNKVELTRLERQFEACMDVIQALRGVHPRPGQRWPR